MIERRTRCPLSLAVSLAALATVCGLAAGGPLVAASATSSTSAEAERTGANLLGRIVFPNSGITEAQAAFVEGVLYLHNFEYEDAAAAFQDAREIDPLFTLAYWGEAMTHNHPIWMMQYRDEANAVLEQYAPTAEERLAKAPTARERDYLETLEILYGNLDSTKDLSKDERDDAYRLAMQRLSEKYPDDDEARAFHALSILGSAHEGRDFATYMRAAATAMPVWERNREHPGAAHYLIHSFDDPVHAPLGLPMAEAYAAIAPDAAHAQHMTSHIFVALGMWPEVVRANIAARRVQNEGQARKGERDVVCGHYPYWLHYGYLQRGELSKADEVMEACQARVRNEPSGGELWHFARMRARDVLDRKDPRRAGQWTVNYDQETASARQLYFIDALAALEAGEVDRAGELYFSMSEAGLSRMETEEQARIEESQLEALIMAARGKKAEALEKLQAAAEAEGELPFAFGPPELVKPSSELLGEFALDMGEVDLAIEAFRQQLLRTPRRTAALHGLARALEAADTPLQREEATAIRSELQTIWVDAEAGTPGLEVEPEGEGAEDSAAGR